MRIIYIDAEFKCHTASDGKMLAKETDFFDGRCDAFVEGYCCEVKENSTAFYPWKPYNELAAAQAQYEKDLADRAELEASYYYLLNGGTPYELHG